MKIKFQNLANWSIAFFDPSTMTIYIDKKFQNRKKQLEIIINHEKKHFEYFQKHNKLIAWLKSFWLDNVGKDRMELDKLLSRKESMKYFLYEGLTFGLIHIFTKKNNHWYFYGIKIK